MTELCPIIWAKSFLPKPGTGIPTVEESIILKKYLVLIYVPNSDYNVTVVIIVSSVIKQKGIGKR